MQRRRKLLVSYEKGKVNKNILDRQPTQLWISQRSSPGRSSKDLSDYRTRSVGHLSTMLPHQSDTVKGTMTLRDQRISVDANTSTACQTQAAKAPAELFTSRAPS